MDLIVCRTVLLAVFWAAANVVLADEAVNRPKVEVPENVYDFGTVAEGTIVRHEFIIKNVGAAPLLIQKVVPGCGCTAASASELPVAPGAETVVKVAFDSAGFSGRKTKLVKVLTNDQSANSFDLTIRGDVEDEVIVDPIRVQFDELNPATEPALTQRRVTVTIKGGSESNLGEPQVFSRHLRILDVTGTPKKREFKVEVLASAPEGMLRDRVVVPILGHRTTTLIVPIFAIIKGNIDVSPASVSFGVVTTAQDRSISLSARGNGMFEIKGIKSSSTAVKTSLVKIEPGRKYVLKVHVTPGEFTGDLKGSVTVETSEGNLIIGVYGTTPPLLG